MSVAPIEFAETDLATARPWVTIVWNDPINLMNYVTFVFQDYFGYDKAKAEKLMLDVHNKGKAVVQVLAKKWNAMLPRCIHMVFGPPRNEIVPDV